MGEIIIIFITKIYMRTCFSFEKVMAALNMNLLLIVLKNKPFITSDTAKKFKLMWEMSGNL